MKRLCLLILTLFVVLFGAVGCVKRDSMEDIEIIVDKIATFFEEERNWRALKNCWLENDRSDDLRRLLYKAIKE